MNPFSSFKNMLYCTMIYFFLLLSFTIVCTLSILSDIRYQKYYFSAVFWRILLCRCSVASDPRGCGFESHWGVTFFSLILKFN